MFLNLMDPVDAIFTPEDFTVYKSYTSKRVDLLVIMECLLKCTPVQLAWEHLVPVQRKVV